MTNPEFIGNCFACGGEIYDYESTQCEGCGNQIHTTCKATCASCKHSGCKDCLLLDEETLERFCDTTGPEDCDLPEPEKLALSECREVYNQNN